MPDSEAELLDASLSLIRAAAANAKAIYLISTRGVAEAGYPLVRSMLELWADHAILIASPDNRNLKRMKVHGGLALTAPAWVDDHDKQKVREVLAAQFPDVYPSAESQWKRSRHGHWSGKGRRALIAEQCGEQYAQLYEFLSWDVHPVVQVYLDTSVAADRSSRRIQHRTPQSELVDQTTTLAAHILRKMWNAAAQRFKPWAPKRRPRGFRRLKHRTS
jgi:hypothetical protein